MKNLKIVLLLCLGLLAGAPSVMAEDLKIGVVNASRVLDQSPQKDRALARLEQEFSSRSQQLEEKSRQLRDKQEKLSRDAAILSDDERQKMEREITSDRRELQRLQDEYSEDLSIRRNEELRQLEEDIAEVIVELAESENYDVVLYQGVIFASDKTDITDQVLEMLKSRAQ